MHFKCTSRGLHPFTSRGAHAYTSRGAHVVQTGCAYLICVLRVLHVLHVLRVLHVCSMRTLSPCTYTPHMHALYTHAPHTTCKPDATLPSLSRRNASMLGGARTPRYM